MDAYEHYDLDTKAHARWSFTLPPQPFVPQAHATLVVWRLAGWVLVLGVLEEQVVRFACFSKVHLYLMGYKVIGFRGQGRLVVGRPRKTSGPDIGKDVDS